MGPSLTNKESNGLDAAHVGPRLAATCTAQGWITALAFWVHMKSCAYLPFISITASLCMLMSDRCQEQGERGQLSVAALHGQPACPADGMSLLTTQRSC